MTSTIKVLYFAALGETLGTTEETVALPTAVETIADLRAMLQDRGGAWFAIAEKNLRFAVNHEVVKTEHAVRHGDEVAFFPPVTGG